MSNDLFILLVNPVIAGVFTCVFVFIWLRIREPYLGYAAATFAIAVVLFTMQSFWPFRDPRTNVMVINLTLVLILVMLSCAALARVGQKIPVKAFMAISTGFLAATAWFAYVSPSLPARIHLANLTMAAIAALAIRGQLQARLNSSGKIILGITVMCGIYFIWRSLSFLLLEAEILQYGTYTHEIFWTFNLLITLVMVVIGALGFMLSLAYDLYDASRQEARTDQLTGILNRRGFEHDAANWLRNNPGADATLVVADIDNFKRINDTFGHETGDRAIAWFGQTLKKQAGPDYIVGRIGGEEFAILLPEIPADEAQRYVEAVRSLLCSGHLPGGPDGFQLTASFGLRARDASESLSEILRGADRALYIAKSEGRDKVSVDKSGSTQERDATPEFMPLPQFRQAVSEEGRDVS